MLGPWKKSYDKPRQLIKSRDITLPTKVHLLKAMVFPVVMYGCESWTLKKVDHWRIDAFELLEKTLESTLDPRISNQSILKEISPKYSLEGLMLKLKLQYFGHLMRRTDSFEKTLMLGKIEGGRRGRQRIRWLDGITNLMDYSTPGLPVHHQLLEFTQTHVHWVSNAIQPSYPLSSPSPTFNLSQH